ncbi:GNAT family N-acetyltransferase [Reinekea sp. G2M2-21]|uniref:GNAT family N-acetyltransferase n=1 Tax=Reinekea sp. G2M2-21 TaxID=2788942 RepID=UPI0018A97841|nr:GNAT family N-acetyltransferase [Reinekea sp. G2M2-21]
MTILQQSVGYPVSRMSAKHYKALALMNAELIQDEGHANTMTLTELEQRIISWLDGGEYGCHAVLHRNLPVSYCIWREEESHLYVRQIFTLRQYRKRGLATKMIEFLQHNVANGKPIRLEVLAKNKQAAKFYQKLGFELYSHTFQR